VTNKNVTLFCDVELQMTIIEKLIKDYFVEENDSAQDYFIRWIRGENLIQIRGPMSEKSFDVKRFKDNQSRIKDGRWMQSQFQLWKVPDRITPVSYNELVKLYPELKKVNNLQPKTSTGKAIGNQQRLPILIKMLNEELKKQNDQNLLPQSSQNLDREEADTQLQSTQTALTMLTDNDERMEEDGEENGKNNQFTTKSSNKRKMIQRKDNAPKKKTQVK